MSAKRALLVFALFYASIYLVGATLNYGFAANDKNRAADASVLGGNTVLFAFSASGWNPVGIEIANPSLSNVQLGIRWNRRGNPNNQATYTPDLLAGTSKVYGGYEIDSVWVNDEGASTTADSLYWEASR